MRLGPVWVRRSKYSLLLLFHMKGLTRIHKQHMRKFISTRKASHKHNRDMSLSMTLTCYAYVNPRYITQPEVHPPTTTFLSLQNSQFYRTISEFNLKKLNPS